MLVLTIGSFDTFHWGHVEFLKKCSELGDSVIVGVNSDKFITKFKNPPVLTLAERLYTIQSIGYKAVPNNSSGRKLISKYAPCVLVIGSDWARKDYLKQIDVTQDWLDDHGVILAYVPYTKGISSTELKKRVRNAKA